MLERLPNAEKHTLEDAVEAERLSQTAQTPGLRRHWESTAATRYLEIGELHDAKRLALQTLKDVGDTDTSYYGHVAEVVLIKVKKRYEELTAF